jgi:hypothetical protein
MENSASGILVDAGMAEHPVGRVHSLLYESALKCDGMNAWPPRQSSRQRGIHRQKWNQQERDDTRKGFRHGLYARLRT